MLGTSYSYLCIPPSFDPVMFWFIWNTYFVFVVFSDTELPKSLEFPRCWDTKVFFTMLMKREEWRLAARRTSPLIRELELSVLLPYLRGEEKVWRLNPLPMVNFLTSHDWSLHKNSKVQGSENFQVSERRRWWCFLRRHGRSEPFPHTLSWVSLPSGCLSYSLCNK